MARPSEQHPATNLIELLMFKNQGRFSSVFKSVCGISSEYVDTLENVTGFKNLKSCCRAPKNKIENAGHLSLSNSESFDAMYF